MNLEISNLFAFFGVLENPSNRENHENDWVSSFFKDFNDFLDFRDFQEHQKEWKNQKFQKSRHTSFYFLLKCSKNVGRVAGTLPAS